MPTSALVGRAAQSSVTGPSCAGHTGIWKDFLERLAEDPDATPDIDDLPQDDVAEEV